MNLRSPISHITQSSEIEKLILTKLDQDGIGILMILKQVSFVVTTLIIFGFAYLSLKVIVEPPIIKETREILERHRTAINQIIVYQKELQRRLDLDLDQHPPMNAIEKQNAPEDPLRYIMAPTK